MMLFYRHTRLACLKQARDKLPNEYDNGVSAVLQTGYKLVLFAVIVIVSDL